MKNFPLLLFGIALSASCSDNPKTIVASADSTKFPIDTIRKPPMVKPPIGKPPFSQVAENSAQDTIRK